MASAGYRIRTYVHLDYINPCALKLTPTEFKKRDSATKNTA